MTMLLPDATIINPGAMKRNGALRGVGQSYTDIPASGDSVANPDSGPSIWASIWSPIGNVLQTTAPTLIYGALNIPSQTIHTPAGSTTVTTTGAQSSRNTWLWVGVIGLGGLLVFSMMRRRRRGR